MDKQNLNFIESNLPKIKGRVLEVGSKNVNGTPRDIAMTGDVESYIGIDMEIGENVDAVVNAKDLPNWNIGTRFDTVLSTCALEHMEDWFECLEGMWEVLKTGGYLVITMASLKKCYHPYPKDYVRFRPDQISEIFGAPVKVEEMGISIGFAVKKKSRQKLTYIKPALEYKDGTRTEVRN